MSKNPIPVSMEKTFWGATRMTFLGLLLDTISQMICIPIEKLEKARTLIYNVLNKKKRNNKKSKKITLEELQRLTGFLNFLGKAISPENFTTLKKMFQTNSKNTTIYLSPEK